MKAREPADGGNAFDRLMRDEARRIWFSGLDPTV